MLATFLLGLAMTTAVSTSASLPSSSYPSCDVHAQTALVTPAGGSVPDPLQAHIAMRANILEADLGSARKARLLTARQTADLYRRVEQVRDEANALAKQQGFLSAAERASYDRELNAIARKLCQR